MNKTILFNFETDKENKKIFVDRSFQAPIDLVWAAWTESDILDQWWAPKPYRTETKSMAFKEGGRWEYSMISPEGERHWCFFEYHKIVPLKSFSGKDGFIDENGVINNSFPCMNWNNTFVAGDDETIVKIQISFDKLEDLETIIKMGFKEGFTMGLQNLDQYISAQFYLRKQKKSSNKSRVSTYINCPGNTEQAFNFYKTVFKSDFVNGIQRFGDIPPGTDHPPVAEAVKKMILHVELPILGGHILMGTDSPKEMGFNLTKGDNMHINLEPETREEGKRIFDALGEGGNVTMPIQDMFWGAYFGSLTDKFGINWMINVQSK